MFSKDTYIKRRSDLKKFVGNGVIILFGKLICANATGLVVPLLLRAAS